jgi:hypothetical protein
MRAEQGRTQKTTGDRSLSDNPSLNLNILTWRCRCSEQGGGRYFADVRAASREADRTRLPFKERIGIDQNDPEPGNQVVIQDFAARHLTRKRKTRCGIIRSPGTRSDDRHLQTRSLESDQ